MSATKTTVPAAKLADILGPRHPSVRALAFRRRLRELADSMRAHGLGASNGVLR